MDIDPKNQELPEAGNQKELEERIEKLLGPTVLEAPSHEEAAKQAVSEMVPLTEEARQQMPGTPVDQPEEPANKPSTVESTDSHEADPPEDSTTSEAVDEIVAEEGDAVLAAEDAEIAEAFTTEKPKFSTKIKKFFISWWNNRLARWITIGLVTLAVVGAAVVPSSRYIILNTFGVRASSTLAITDDSSHQPLKNVRVSLGGQSELTDGDGKVKLEHLRLGKSILSIEKRAFAPSSKSVVVGWGSNPLGDFSLKAVGSRYIFTVKDFLSGKPISKAEAVSGEASAVADSEGKISLATETNEDDTMTVTITAKTYRDEKLTFSPDLKTEQKVSLVPARKAVFISKRSGKFDLYKVDVDGKDEQVVLKGSGTEQDNIALVPHPNDELVAFVSTRDNVRNSDGFLLSTLTLVELSSNSAKTVAQSESIQVVGWSDERLVYLQIAAGTSAGNSKRFRLLSYSIKTQEKKELAAGNYFNDVAMHGGNVFYSLSSAFQSPSTVGLFRTRADGSGKQTIIDQEVWSIIRSAYDTLDLAVGQDWYENKLGELKSTKLSGRPASLEKRIYVDGPENDLSLWVDQRDGKGVLLSYNTKTKADKTLKTQSGIDYPIRWLNSSTVIYRVHSSQETADYVISVDGGEAKKVSDVTNSSGAYQGNIYY